MITFLMVCMVKRAERAPLKDMLLPYIVVQSNSDSIFLLKESRLSINITLYKLEIRNHFNNITEFVFFTNRRLAPLGQNAVLGGAKRPYLFFFFFFFFFFCLILRYN